MLFNSYSFLFGFLPIALIGYQIAARWHRRAVVRWLVIISFVFYGWWRPEYLFLLCGSILFNYLSGALISRSIPNRVSSKLLLGIAIAANIGALCYFKYLVPSLNGMASMWHSTRHWTDVLLPLGISFFTFTQIAYLVDLEQGAATQQDLESYALFVTFFPHLIAGPIIHHAEIMPQFQRERDFRLRMDDISVGLTWFIMGLFKKVVFADRFAADANDAFHSIPYLHTGAAWMGALCYSLQLYFDFSGYSDMALGLARMFSIDFPLNFSSPYKAKNIIDFWQRWHITLTRYLTSYLYNPISMWINRRRVRQGKKISRKATATASGFAQIVVIPTVTTLFLAGIWHGAGKQFIVFGLLHGGYLCVNHAWRVFKPERWDRLASGFLHAQVLGVASLLLTYVAVLVAQIFFRADSVHAAASLIGGMLGQHHLVASQQIAFQTTRGLVLRLLLGFFIVWFLPNTQQILERFKPSLGVTAFDLKPSLVSFRWKPTPTWGLALGAVLFFTLVKMQVTSTFLYFQF